MPGPRSCGAWPSRAGWPTPRSSPGRPAGCSATTRPGAWRRNSPAVGSRSATSTSSTRRASGTSRPSPRSGARCTRSRPGSSPTSSAATARWLGLLDADHTFLNAPLAEHYGIPFDPAGDPQAWRRVDGVKRFGRGGVLGQATTLAKPVRRVADQPDPPGELDQRGPPRRAPAAPAQGRPPRLPDDEAATAGLTVRQLVEKHAADAKCATCHQRIDPLGFALEGFDAIGRFGARSTSAAGRSTPGPAPRTGRRFEGIDGLKDYLLSARREAFLKQFCRKLLGFALGPLRPSSPTSRCWPRCAVPSRRTATGSARRSRSSSGAASSARSGAARPPTRLI